MRVRRLVVAAAATAAVAAATAGCGGIDDIADGYRSDCEIVVDGDKVTLSAEQAANAATIAAVGLSRDVPERGIVVALATAWQESKMRNIDYGDRDSVGLFQQRPSQGWGTEEEIMDQRYASMKFYEGLEEISDWEEMRVTEAAQAVQLSAYPEEYEKWADDSEIMTAAFAGNAGSALSCRSGEDSQPDDAVPRISESLLADWGEETVYNEEADDLSVPVDSEQEGWRYASWLVAHAGSHGVSSVHYDGYTWNSAEGAWDEDDDVEVAHVTAQTADDQNV